MKTRKSFLAALLVAVTMLGFSYTPLGAQTIQRSFARVGRMFVGDGSVTAPSIAFNSEPGLGFYRVGSQDIGVAAAGAKYYDLTTSSFGLASALTVGWNGDTFLARGGAAGKLTLTGTTPTLQLGGTTSSFPSIKQNGAKASFRLADDSGFATITVGNIESGPSGNLLFSATAPTLGTCAGFGTSPAMSTTNGAASFLVTVGSATPLSGTCTVTLPTAATGWNCAGEFRTSTATMKETSTTTTTAVMTVTGTPTAAEVAQLRCAAY